MPSYKPTIGADFSTHDVAVDGQTIGLQMWDTAGQERFLSIGHAFYKGSDCCVIVYDVTQPDTFNSIPNWRREFQDCTTTKDSENLPFVVVGNKVDRENDRKVPAEKARAWCKNNGDIPYFETSAKSGAAVKDAFLKAASLALKNRKANTYSLLSLLRFVVASCPLSPPV